MQSIQQKCRPKHQVLVLKCYPRTNKTTIDVKPNSSELSYLLFYLISRKTKINKVGEFLEKKTASDVWHQRIGYVSSAEHAQANMHNCTRTILTQTLHTAMSRSRSRSSRP